MVAITDKQVSDVFGGDNPGMGPYDPGPATWSYSEALTAVWISSLRISFSIQIR